MLQGRRILVTGASSGIGQAVAIACAEHGAAVVFAVGRDRERLEGTARGHATIAPVVADVTTLAGRRAVAGAVSGGLDVAIHAAGALGMPATPLVRYPAKVWREVLEVNLTAIHLLHGALAVALAAGASPAVVVASSTVGRAPRPGWGAYAVSKHALEGWVALLAAEWPSGRVYSVNPGGTATPMRATAVPGEDPASLPTPRDVTPLFLRLAHPAAPEPSGSALDARPWIGRDPWEGLDPGRIITP